MSSQHKASVSESVRRRSVAEEPVTSVLKPGEIIVVDRDFDADEEVLAALGYKPEFKREFSLWTTFCVSFAVLGLLPSFASTLYYGMGYSGTPGMVWGWLVAMIFIQCVAAGMGKSTFQFVVLRFQEMVTRFLAWPMLLDHGECRWVHV